MIIIYDDKGVSSQCVKALMNFLSTKQDVKCVSGHELQETQWLKNTKMLIMPGGRSVPFYKTLGAQGNHHIREFVEQGGCYFGICAGAYYACSETIFAKGFPLEVMLAGALHFFPGRAIGPVFAGEDFAYDSEKGARVVDIAWHDNHVFSTYFNGGCYFDHVDHDTKIIATYVDNKKPAIITRLQGLGRVILSGVHPEWSYHHIPNDHDLHHQALRKKLKEKKRDNMQILSYLLDLGAVRTASES